MKAKKRRAFKYAAIMLLFTAVVIFFTGCTNSCFDPPVITGTADDGLWLYYGNNRMLSDTSGREPIISSLNVDGEVLNEITVTSTVYTSDNEVFMCVIDTSSEIYVGYFIVYDLHTKKSEIIYSDDASGLIPAKIVFASHELILLANSNYTTAEFFIINRISGEIVESNFSYDRTHHLTEDYIFWIDEGMVKCRTWLDNKETILLTVSYAQIDIVQCIYFEGNVLIVKTVIYNSDLTCHGAIAYNMTTRQSIVLVDPRDGHTISGDVGIGHEYYGKHKNTGGTYSAAGYKESEIWRFDFDNFTNTLIHKLVDTERGYVPSYSLVDDRYLNIQCTWYANGEHRYKSYYLDTQKDELISGSYSSKSKSVYYNILAENDDYFFYQTSKSGGFFTVYTVLNRYNKKSGASDVMAYVSNDDNEWRDGYHIDAIRYY